MQIFESSNCSRYMVVLYKHDMYLCHVYFIELFYFQKIQVRSSCDKCGGYRFLPCTSCHGSKKSLHRNEFTEEFCALRCMQCDENGLVRCVECIDQQEWVTSASSDQYSDHLGPVVTFIYTAEPKPIATITNTKPKSTIGQSVGIHVVYTL